MLFCYQSNNRLATEADIRNYGKNNATRRRYTEFCQRAAYTIMDKNERTNDLPQYYRQHPCYPDTKIVIEMASFLRDLKEDIQAQKSFLQDLMLLSCLLDMESSKPLQEVGIVMVDSWRLRFESSLETPYECFSNNQTIGLIQIALFRRLLCASGRKAAKWMESFILKSKPSQNLELLGSAIGVRGQYSSKEEDIERVSAILTSHHLFAGMDISKEAIKARLRILRMHVPIAYPDIVSHLRG